MNSKWIYDKMVRRMIQFPDFDSAVRAAFQDVMTELDRSLMRNRPKKQSEFVEAFAEVDKFWEEAANLLNTDLVLRGSNNGVDTRAFRMLLRATVPGFYLKLVIGGLNPLPDEVAQVLELRKSKGIVTVADEIVKTPAKEKSNGRKRHKSSKGV